jgi:Ohr subfamily peroxiredoxin
MKILYTAEAHVEQGRAGHARSSDGALDVELSVPTELGGQGGPGTNPEQMFAAGYGACFLGAVMTAARRKRVEIGDMQADVKVGLGPQPGGAYTLAVELNVAVAGIDRELTQELLELAHETCPYSNATRGNVEVTLNAVDRVEA